MRVQVDVVCGRRTRTSRPVDGKSEACASAPAKTGCGAGLSVGRAQRRGLGVGDGERVRVQQEAAGDRSAAAPRRAGEEPHLEAGGMRVRQLSVGTCPVRDKQKAKACPIGAIDQPRTAGPRPASLPLRTTTPRCPLGVVCRRRSRTKVFEGGSRTASARARRPTTLLSRFQRGRRGFTFWPRRPRNLARQQQAGCECGSATALQIASRARNLARPHLLERVPAPASGAASGAPIWPASLVQRPEIRDGRHPPHRDALGVSARHCL